MSDPQARLLELTDALLACTRVARPNLEVVSSLLEERGALLGGLGPPQTGEEADRVSALRRVQAADAEVRAIFAERHAVVRDELRRLAFLGHRPRTLTTRSRMVDSRA